MANKLLTSLVRTLPDLGRFADKRGVFFSVIGQIYMLTLRFLDVSFHTFSFRCPTQLSCYSWVFFGAHFR